MTLTKPARGANGMDGSDPGNDGEDGALGTNGTSFFLSSQTLMPSSSKNLLITSLGGDGGDGGHGANGAVGADGKNGAKGEQTVIRFIIQREILICNTSKGTDGTAGTDGSNGKNIAYGTGAHSSDPSSWDTCNYSYEYKGKDEKHCDHNLPCM